MYYQDYGTTVNKLKKVFKQLEKDFKRKSTPKEEEAKITVRIRMASPYKDRTKKELYDRAMEICSSFIEDQDIEQVKVIVKI